MFPSRLRNRWRVRTSTSFRSEDTAERPRQDPGVEAKALVPEVIELVLELLERVALAPGVAVLHLRPSREPRAYQVPQAVIGQLLRQLGHVVRLLRSRSDDGEIAAHDVDRLRQLVEMRAPQRAPEPRDARIVLGGPLVGHRAVVRPHGTELEDRQLASVTADAPLSVEQRTAVRDEVADRDERQHDTERGDSDRADDDVEQPLRASI